MSLRVLHLSTKAGGGGAGRAALSLHRQLLREGVQSHFHAGLASETDDTVSSMNQARLALTRTLDRQLWRLQVSPHKTWRSPARFGALDAEWINRQDVDVVNLHWVTDGFMSIEEIGKIKKPIVWSMYDMWIFSGTEHYVEDSETARWRLGYTRENRLGREYGFDLDLWAYGRKARSWLSRDAPIHLVPASTWLAECAKTSALAGNWPGTTIQHAVDQEIFAPLDMTSARRQLGWQIPESTPLVLFVSSAGITDPRKGWDHLERAVIKVRESRPDLGVIVVGPRPHPHVKQEVEERLAGAVIWHGPTLSDHDLQLLYCATDVTAIPSRQDNLPLTALEALACARPVLGYRIGGLPDLVCSPDDGYLAQPFEPEDLANGLAEILAGPSREFRRLTTRDSLIGQEYVRCYIEVLNQVS